MKNERDQEIRDTLLKSYCSASVKKLTDADVNFIVKYITPKVNDPMSSHVLRQPFSGANPTVNEYMYRLVGFIYDLDRTQFSPYTLKSYGLTEGNKIQMFDRARMIVLKLDNNLYSNFID